MNRLNSVLLNISGRVVMIQREKPTTDTESMVHTHIPIVNVLSLLVLIPEILVILNHLFFRTMRFSGHSLIQSVLLLQLRLYGLRPLTTPT